MWDKGRLFLVPVSPPVRFEGVNIAFFLNGRFLKILVVCRSGAAFPCGFTFSFLDARPPVHFGDLELTITKNKGFRNVRVVLQLLYVTA